MTRRFDFLGVQISDINLPKAEAFVKAFPFDRPAYICFPDASVIREAGQDAQLRAILNAALLTMPDGKPSQLAARLQGFKDVRTVSGFHLCKALLQTDLTHYFYGGSEDMLTKIRLNLQANYPKAKILGFKSPPFVEKEAIETNAEIAGDIAAINRTLPDILWIGISSPKQDYLMHHFFQQLDKTIMMGVGGVFLYLADESLKSPEWMKKMGLRWAFRLAKEPARLWPKYLDTFKFLAANIPYFLQLPMKRKQP